MSPQPDLPTRPSPGRVAAIILLGPFIGSMAVFIAPLILDPPADGGAYTLKFLPFLFFFGYLFGLIPSAVAGISYSALYVRLGQGWLRWLQCFGIGAASGALLVHPLVWMFAGRPVLEPGMLVMGGLAGGVALPLTALTFRRKS